MKKKIVLAMAIIMVLGSVKAMAENSSDERYYESEIYQELQLDKTYAAEEDSKRLIKVDPIAEISKTIEGQISRIKEIKDNSQPELMASVHETVRDAVKQHQQLEKAKNLRALQELSANLDNAWDQLNKMDERNIIRGLRLNDELRY